MLKEEREREIKINLFIITVHIRSDQKCYPTRWGCDKTCSVQYIFHLVSVCLYWPKLVRKNRKETLLSAFYRSANSSRCLHYKTSMQSLWVKKKNPRHSSHKVRNKLSSSHYFCKISLHDKLVYLLLNPIK